MKKIICLENLPYNSHIKIGSHHYAELFSSENEVLWISLPFHILQLIKDKNSDRVKNWNKNKPNKINDNFHSFTPFTLFPYRNNFILKSSHYLNNYIYFIRGIRKVIKNLGFSNPDVVWFTDPRHYSILKAINPDKIYYRCVDNLEHFDDIPNNLIKLETQLIQQADGVFFTAKDLMNKFNGINPNSYYLPNGCNYEFFNDSHTNENNLKKVKSFFKKDSINILYFGAIAEWFDFNFIEQASNSSKYNIIIVGPVRTSVPANLKKKDNITFVGPVEYSIIPYFAQNADVGIIPFLVNKMTDSVNPIKLYEYMAAGLPTIVSPFKTVKEINGPYLFYNKDDKVEKIIEKAYLLRNDNVYIKKIKKFAEEHSWKSKYLEIKKIWGQ